MANGYTYTKWFTYAKYILTGLPMLNDTYTKHIVNWLNIY